MSPGWLRRLGLETPAARGWALYDWANSAMVTTVITAVYPIYFGQVAGSTLPAGEATVRFGVASTVALLVVALLSPILGAVADSAPLKKPLLAVFVALGVLSTAGLFFVDHGDWLLGAVLFGLANIGVNGSFVFYDALLPHVARTEAEMDRLSTAAYGLGYLGGGLLLVVQLAVIQRPAWFGLPDGTLPSRLVFVSVAAWWVVFSIPLFLRVKEPPITREPRPARRFRETARDLATYKQALLMLVAFLVYNDGIGTIIRMATIYGVEIGIGRAELIAAVLLVQFVGVPFAFLFGMLAARIGAQRAILIGLSVYMVISAIGFFMQTAAHFFLLAGLVGMVQGGTQALSRSLFGSLIPREKSGEFFGFFSVMDKAAGVLGPLVFSASAILTGSSRNAILSVVVFFVVGGFLLSRVKVAEGQRQATGPHETGTGL